MMTGEMGLALIETTIGVLREVMTEADLGVLMEERGGVLIMVVDGPVAQVQSVKVGQALIMVGALVRIPIIGKGILSMAVAVVQTLERRGTLIMEMAIAQTLEG